METFDRQLRYFLQIAELKSLSKAAAELEQSQPWISRQLSALEDYIGKPLFVRTGRGVDLTECGQQLYDALRPLYRDVDHAMESIREVHGFTRGTVRLATVHTLNYYFTAEVVADLVKMHPEVNLSLLGRSSPEVVALVESGKADVGFVYDTAVDTGGVVSSPLFEDEMCLIVHQDCGTVADGGVDMNTVRLRLVGFPEHYALRRMFDAGCAEPHYVAEVETIDAMLKMVSLKVGACVLPSHIPDKLLRDFELKKVKIINPLMRRRVVAITHAERRALPIVGDLLQCALRVSREIAQHR
jgi:DNA-binding transcriptional LysR family regulator